MRWSNSRRGFITAFFVCLLVLSPNALAQTLQSTNYKMDETSIGTSSPIGQSSSNFGLTSGVGDIGVGNATSANFQINAGSKTNADPVLAFSVNNAVTNFGTFSPSLAATATTTFSVMNYTSYGYTVQLTGNAPSNGAHTINALGSAATSQTGTEQFGVNLVANTQPTSVGANPDNGAFGYGSVDDNYKTSNYYRYVNGDTIAKSLKSSGVTNYTLTYLINVAGLTPGGQYKSNQTLIVLGTY
jgi:hypothetical protein